MTVEKAAAHGRVGMPVKKVIDPLALTFRSCT